MTTSCPEAVLLCDDDRLIHESLKMVIGSKFVTLSCYSKQEATQKIAEGRFRGLILDLTISSQNDGLEILADFRGRNPKSPILVLSGNQDLKVARKCFRLGAVDYFLKGEPLEPLLQKLETFFGRDIRGTECERASDDSPLKGDSFASARIRDTIHRLGRKKVNILLLGESGTGKEVVAKEIYRLLAETRSKPFIVIDSATLLSSTAVSTLFGHEKGAFTGAQTTKKGLFEEASGGFLYLDEVANCSLEVQNYLLRAIQEGEVLKLGASKPIKVDVQIIAATNQDLNKLSQEGKFKFDLYQRLSVFPLKIPPLRDRREDINLLILHFTSKHYPDQIMKFSPECLNILNEYSWPGNVRELENLILFLGIMVDNEKIVPSDLPPQFSAIVESEIMRSATNSLCSDNLSDRNDHNLHGNTLSERVRHYEKSLLEEELEKNNSTISDLAKKLGLDRTTLYQKIRAFGIDLKKKKN